MAHEIAPTYKVTYGQVLPAVTVTKVEGNIGVLAALPDGGYAFANGSSLVDSDKHEKKKDVAADKNTIDRKKFAPGTKHKGRISGFHPMENLAMISFRSSIIDQPFLSTADVKVGDIVEAVVIEVNPSGMIVALSHSIRAFCHADQMSDHSKKTPPAVGAALKCRVVVNSEIAGNRRLLVTNKRSLVESTLPIITSIATAERGMASHGTVLATNEHGCRIKFFNDVVGWAPISMLSATEVIKNPSESFKNGQTVKCFVLEANPLTNKLIVSLKPISDSTVHIPILKDEKAVFSVGSKISLVVKDHSAGGLQVTLASNSKIQFLLPAFHLTDHFSLTSYISKLYPVGSTLDDVLVSSKDDQSYRVVLTNKPALKKAFESSPKDFSELKGNTVYTGFINNVRDNGCYVELPGGLRGFVDIKHMSLGLNMETTPTSVYHIGQTVQVKAAKARSTL